jgi:hypothetical protein
MRPELTLTAGVRYELQTNIGDRRSFAPRVAIAWAPGGSGGRGPLAVVRGGFGMFYDRVSESLSLQARHLDGVRQSPYVVADPDFYSNIPSDAVLAANRQD